MRWCHIPIFQSESVITVTRTTVAVQAFQFLNISFCYTLFCFYLQLVNHPLRTLLWPGRGPDFQLVVIAAMVTSYARSSSSIKARYLHPTKSFISWTRSSVRQANRIIQLEIYENQLEFFEASMNAKGASSAALLAINPPTFLQIIIVANRPTLPFSWGGGRRFVTGHRQIKDRRRETMDLHQALRTSDKSTATASYAFNHIPKTQDTLSTQHSASTFDIATFDDRHAITISVSYTHLTLPTSDLV